MSGIYISDGDESNYVPGYVPGTQISTYQPLRFNDDPETISPGSKTDSPFAIANFGVSGEITPVFFDDWYNRIHVIPTTIDLLNVVTDQTRTIILWNAYLEPKTLLSTSFPLAQGVSIVSPVTPPYEIRALETLNYTLNVSSDGPPVIDVTLTWEIEGEEPFTVGVSGRRIVVWPFGPNWSTPITESLDWFTDVLESHSGDEQRFQLRTKPRRQLEYLTTVTKEDAAIASNLLWGWQNRNYALPIWYDRSLLTSAVTAGATSIPVDTTNRGYFNGGLVILIADPLTYEVVEIDSFTSSSIVLAKQLEKSWPKDTEVYPINISQLPVNVPSRRLTSGASEISISFLADPVQTDPYIPTGAAAVTYNGYEVILRRPNWAQPVGIDNQFDYDMIDFQVGGFRAYPTRTFPKINRRFQWVIKNRADAVEFRKLLGRLKGRHKAAYLPTWFDDFQLYSTEVASSVTIRVKNNEFYKMVGSDPALKTLMIRLNSGAVIIRLINSVGTDPAGFTTLGLDANIGADLNASTLKQLSLVHLCRLSSDRVTINHLSDGVSTVEANFTLVKA